MSQSRERDSIESLYALDMAALHGRPVCQGHADYCAAHGHGKNVRDGVELGWCPRCGEVTVPARVSEPMRGPAEFLADAKRTAEQIEARQRDEDAAYRQAAVAQYGPTPTAAERVSEPINETPEETALREAEERAGFRPVAVTGGKAERTERVRTSELTAGDVIEYDSGVRETVLSVGETRLIGALHYRQVTLVTAGAPNGIRCKLQTGARWDRLTEQAKRELGYPVADVDVASVREPREPRKCNRCVQIVAALRFLGNPLLTEDERAGLHESH